jgi:hypothetical protein
MTLLTILCLERWGQIVRMIRGGVYNDLIGNSMSLAEEWLEGRGWNGASDQGWNLRRSNRQIYVLSWGMTGGMRMKWLVCLIQCGIYDDLMDNSMSLADEWLEGYGWNGMSDPEWNLRRPFSNNSLSLAEEWLAGWGWNGSSNPGWNLRQPNRQFYVLSWGMTGAWREEDEMARFIQGGIYVVLSVITLFL